MRIQVRTLAPSNLGRIAPMPWLNGKHDVFNEATGGMEIAEAVEATMAAGDEIDTRSRRCA